MRQTQELRLGQNLTLTPQMHQAIRLLQLSSVELDDELRDLAEANYMLELVDDQSGEEWDAVPIERERRAPDSFPGPEESLRERLFGQLESRRLSDEERLIGAVIIDSIDERGYLESSMAELADALVHLGLEVEPGEIEEILRRIQRFDPPGVAARTLSECLLRQLEEAAADTAYRALAMTIARSHLEAVARGDLADLRRRLRTTGEELEGALALLRGLNPRPGADHAGPPTEYVIPELRVRRSENEWRVELNPGAMPKLQINPLYAGLVRRNDRGAENLSLQWHLSEARTIVRSVGNRNETMLRVARAIFRRQPKFLERGDEAMRPLVLLDIASELGMHESTVSRVTRGKYVQTPRGVFELKHFFSNRVATADGGSASTTALRSHLRRIIKGEDPGRPRSDQRLASDLERSGFRIARRTVAKYRDSMGIPPSNERRRVGAGHHNLNA